MNGVRDFGYLGNEFVIVDAILALRSFGRRRCRHGAGNDGSDSAQRQILVHLQNRLRYSPVRRHLALTCSRAHQPVFHDEIADSSFGIYLIMLPAHE